MGSDENILIQDLKLFLMVCEILNLLELSI
jgi:hypothetical protein